MEQIIPVSLLGKYIKQIFEAEELLFNIKILGEVTNLKTVRGVSYFDLKDEFALISCVCFTPSILDNISNGDKIVAKGTPNYYVKGGRLNFSVVQAEHYGIGDLYKKFLETKEKLEKEGLFETSHKKPLPESIKNIGVISSETGAVIQDIINVATRRNPAVNIILFPAKVQGAGSYESIIRGIDFFEDYAVDVVIIARGGGSMEDLNEFNAEPLAHRIYAAQKPIISAVGHETDFTICDFVSDLRAPTPSAAAELATFDAAGLKNHFQKQLSSIKYLLNVFLGNLENAVQSKQDYFLDFAENLIQENEYDLALKSEKLARFNPQKILKLGYARIEKGNEVITSKKSLEKTDKITIHFADGSVKGEII